MTAPTKRRADPVDLWECLLIVNGLTGTAHVTINGTGYDLHVSPLTRVATLTKADGQVYTVGGERPCDCDDMRYRRRACKHALALKRLLPYLLGEKRT